MLDPASWLDKAQALPVGGKGTYKHDCGDGRKLVVNNKKDGYSAYCYRCGEPGWVPKAKPSLAERIKALNAQRAKDAALTRSIKPPMPAIFNIREWPDEARVWLYKSGLSNEWIEDLGFYWCPDAKRVVMPVLDDVGKLVFWQARTFTDGMAKYLSPELGEAQNKPLFKAEPYQPVPEYRPDVLCLTEDILSAVRVSQVCSGWSLLGTKLSALHEAALAKFRPSKVWVWLDPDQAGIDGRRKIVPHLRSLGYDAKAVRADLDPKLYPLQDIRRKLLVP